MNYRKMLNIGNNNIQTDVVGEPNEMVDQLNGIVNTTQKVEQMVESMFSIMRNNNTVTSAPPDVEYTVLNDMEIADVLSYLLELQTKYFGDKIPLSQDLCKQFMWNIPRQVYEAFCEARDYGIDAMNPITLFYLFCVDDTKEVVCKFIDIFVNDILNEQDWGYISNCARKYDEYMEDYLNDNNDQDG